MKFNNQKNRSILREMVSTDFKVRYQGSVLGYFWSLLKPTLLFAILYVVFTKFLRIGADIPHFPTYLLFGIVIWSFFSEATSAAMGSIVGRGDLIRKISIPRYLLVISSNFSALINFGLNLIVVMVFAIFNDIEPSLAWLLVPVLFVELWIMSLAVGFILAALYVKYRDVTYIWEVALQAGFYATPILYPLSLLAVKYQQLLMLNPVAQVVQDARWALISDTTITGWKILPSPYTLIPFIITILLSVIAVAYFRRESKYFAENV